MDKKVCNKIIEHKSEFTPSIFTRRQIDILQKYLSSQKLKRTEKTYLYSSIKKKIDALSLLNEEFYYYGKNMIPERVAKAREMLGKISEKAFISGSFLFSEKYNDIDLYIVSSRRKQFTKGSVHFIHIAESDLKKPVFISAAQYCFSNFPITIMNPIIKRMGFNDLVMAYEMSINEILYKEGQKTIRDVIFEYFMQIKNKILDSYELKTKMDEIAKSKDSISTLNSMVAELLLNNYSRRYIYDELVKFTKRLGQDIKEFKANENLIIYKEVFDRVKDECRRAEA